MRILVTGGSGFVGGSLAPLLRARHDVLLPTSRELNLLDATNVASYLAANPVDVVLHGAVRGSATELGDIVVMHAHLMRALDALGGEKRLVFFGSGAELAKHRDMRMVSEGEVGALVPRDTYGLGKLFCNSMARASENQLNLRLFGVYGPRENHMRKFISNAVVKHIAGMDLVVRQDVLFHYLWIDDLLPIVEWALASTPPKRDYNVVPTDAVTLTEIARTINRVGGREAKITVETEGMNFAYTASNARLLRDMSPLAFTSLERGVEALFAHHRARWSAVDVDALRRDDYARSVKLRAPGAT